MTPMILFATIAITCALVFYTCGVFAERRAQLLKLRYVVLFWLGLACDTTGTLTMTAIANSTSAASAVATSAVPAVATAASADMGFHAATGLAAIILMLIHALWATFTAWRGSERAMRIFSRFSIAVWLVWLIPYVCGMLVGIPAISLGAEIAVPIAVCVALAIGGIICLRTNIRKRALRKGNAHA